MDSNEFSCSSSFVVIKLYISHIKKNKSFFPSITWISASLQKQEDEVIKNFFMVGPDWFWVGAAVKQHKEKPTPLSFFPRNTALKKKKKIRSLKLNIDWNLLWTMSKCLASQCLILSSLRAIVVERYYLKDTQLSHPFLPLTQSSEAHELWQTWEVKRISSYTSCKEDVNEDGQRMSDIKWWEQ